jgi:hypothetical protein
MLDVEHLLFEMAVLPAQCCQLSSPYAQARVYEYRQLVPEFQRG